MGGAHSGSLESTRAHFFIFSAGKACRHAVMWETYRVVILMSCQSTSERTMRALDLQLACDHPKRLVCWGQLIYLRLTPFSSTSTLVNLCDVVILLARHGSFDCADC